MDDKSPTDGMASSSSNSQGLSIEEHVESLVVSHPAEVRDDSGDIDPSIPIPDSGLDPQDDTSEVIIQQNDPNSPLFSVKTFDQLGLKDELLQGIYGMKFNKPSRIQEASLPLILANPPRNLVAQAHNGSGKTACFVLGMLSRVDVNVRSPQALCVAPTRELARQIMEVAQRMGKYTKITYFLAVKDSNMDIAELKRLRVEEHVVIGTPGKIKGFIEHRNLNPRAIKMFVLDEADEMLDKQGFQDECIRIKRILPPAVQCLFFSATFPERVQKFAMQMVTEPNIISVKREQLSIEGIKQLWMECGGPGGADNRFQILSDIYALLTIGQSIIFVNRRETAQDLTRRMREAEHTVSVLHGADMSTSERDRVIDEFRTGKTKVLLTTNVLSRGIDISQVSLVINYDMPFNKFGRADPETYLHRIGRTGRFGRKGVAINLVFDDASRKCLREIITTYLKEITEIKPENIEELEKMIRDR